MQVINKPFEIPYNFDTKLIHFLQTYDINLHCLYMPPFGEDYPYSAKYNTINIGKHFLDYNFPEERKDYELHMSFMGKLPKMLLLQSNKYIMPNNLLQYYRIFGFNKFCVGTIEQAKVIKDLYPEAEILGSITMKIQPDEILSDPDNFYSYFDGFVLPFNFNKNLELLSNMPKGFKYSLLVNCHCATICEGTHHWFISKEDELSNKLRCPKIINPELENYKDTIFIRPDHLYLFNDYISYIKLQGRERSTKEIIQDIILYTTNLDKYYLFEKFDINSIF